MKEKYVEARYPRWFVFSIDRQDVDCSEGHVGRGETPDDAARLVEQHNLAVQALCDMALAWSANDPEAFKAFWYQ